MRQETFIGMMTGALVVAAICHKESPKARAIIRGAQAFADARIEREKKEKAEQEERELKALQIKIEETELKIKKEEARIRLASMKRKKLLGWFSWLLPRSAKVAENSYSGMGD